MKTSYMAAIGGSIVLAGAALTACHPADGRQQQKTAAAEAVAHERLATVSPSAGHDVDYSLLDARLQRLMDRPAMVGLAVGVVEHGRITFLKGYGVTHSGSKDSVTAETVFRWASLSKGVAATLATKLAEQGKIDLEAPISRYGTSLRLPGGAEQSATVADLLSHRLGIYRNAYDNKLEEGQNPRVLRSQIGQLSPVCSPGTCWNYENVAYDDVSEIVERVTGKPYQQVVEQRLFDPLGMTSASLTMQGLMSSPSWARPHNAGHHQIELNNNYYRIPAAGGVNSDIKDMSLWLLAQMGEMPNVVSPQVLRTIHQPLVKTPNERGRLHVALERLHTAWYGFGWRSYEYAGHRIVGHRGGVSGYRSLILFDPEQKSGVVALWNSNTSQPGGLEFEVMDMIYHLPFRDWLNINDKGAPTPATIDDQGPSDSGGGSH